MPARNARGQFMRDDGFDINIPHPFTILKYLIFFYSSVSLVYNAGKKGFI